MHGRVVLGACVAIAAAVPGGVALAHSVEPANLFNGRFELNNGYIDVEYNTTIKKIDFIQAYYPCRAAGPSHSQYPAFISLSATRRASLHGGHGSGSFTYTITDTSDSKAVGDAATVAWTVRGVQLSKPGLSGTLNLAVTGPRAVCPFTLKNKRLVPLLDIPGNA